MAAAVSNAHVTETDMHVQHSERTARDQLVISQLPTDSAQVAQTVESMRLALRAAAVWKKDLDPSALRIRRPFARPS